MLFRNVLYVTASLLAMGCQGQKKADKLQAESFSQKLHAETHPQLIDVRTPEEYAGGHLEDAVNLNWNDSGFADKAAAYDPSKPIFVYCLSGGRSARAAQKLVDLGFAQVYDLNGGIMKWNAEGFSVSAEKIIGMCSQEFGELLKSQDRVLVNFYAKWCEPCKNMQPFIEKMQKEYEGKVSIVRLDADEHKTLVKELKISELPTLLLYDKAELKWKHTGFLSEADLKKQL